MMRTTERSIAAARLPRLACALICLAGAARADAGEALVAVAANFSAAMEQLRPDFEAAAGHQLTLVNGSTGKLYAQIKHGAPFDVLLAADQERPRRLVAEGLAVAGSRFTYARGQLTLWSAEADRIGANGAAALAEPGLRLAIANPALAPYGAAAEQVLKALGLDAALRGRIVMGENIGQAHAMVATGNAQLGLLARSYVLSPRNRIPGSRWDVPDNLYEPIRQDAVLLQHGRDNGAARALLGYLATPGTRAVIASLGYGLEP